MSVTHTILRQYKDTSSQAVQFSETVTGNVENNLDDSIAVLTDHLITWAATRANLQSLVIYAAGAVTIKTNSSGSPVDNFTLVAGQALCWTLATDGLAKCPFSANVTALYVTNAGSGAVAFKIRCALNQ